MGGRKWQLVAVIMASSAALLGTSEDPVAVTPSSSYTTTYTFERKDIDGAGVDLTGDLPRATYYVNVRADALGPMGVNTTSSATATVEADVTSEGLAEGQLPPQVNFLLRTANAPGTSETLASAHYTGAQPLLFVGNCSDPKVGAACRASFALEMSRSDDGRSGGTVHVDWRFSVNATGTLPSSTESSTIGPDEPPWTIEVVQ